MREIRYKKIAQTIVASMVDEISSLLHRNREPNLYYSLEKHIMDAMNGAFKEGQESVRAEVLRKIQEFDEKKDPLGS